MKSRPVVAIAVAMGFIVVLWYMVVYSGAKSDVSSTKSQIEKAESDRSTLQQQKSALQKLAKDAPELESRLAAFRQAIPENDDLASFIEQVNLLGTKTGVKWVSVAPTEPTLASGVGTIQMSIEVSGGYNEVFNYLTELENMPRLLIVDTVNLHAAAAATSTSATPGESTGDALAAPNLSATLSARMFTQEGVSAASDASHDASTTPTTTLAGSAASSGGN